MPKLNVQSAYSYAFSQCVLRPTDAVLIIASDSNHACSAWVAQLHVCRQLGYLDTPQ